MLKKSKRRKPLHMASAKKIVFSMTPRQRAYARYRYRGYDPEQAYRMAGYNGNGNHQAYLRKLENMPKIRSYIQKLFDENVNDSDDGLTVQERRFVEEYLIDFNRHRAIKEAGYPVMYPARMARHLLQRPDIIEAIEKREKERSLRTLITADRILHLLWTWATFDIRRLYDKDGNLKNVHELDSDSARTIRKIKQFAGSQYWNGKKRPKGYTGKVVEFVIEERKSAAELIGKHLEMFTDKIKGTLDARIAGVLVAPGIMDKDSWHKTGNEWREAIPEMIPDERFRDDD